MKQEKDLQLELVENKEHEKILLSYIHKLIDLEKNYRSAAENNPGYLDGEVATQIASLKQKYYREWDELCEKRALIIESMKDTQK